MTQVIAGAEIKVLRVQDGCNHGEVFLIEAHLIFRQVPHGFAVGNELSLIHSPHGLTVHRADPGDSSDDDEIGASDEVDRSHDPIDKGSLSMQCNDGCIIGNEGGIIGQTINGDHLRRSGDGMQHDPLPGQVPAAVRDND